MGSQWEEWLDSLYVQQESAPMYQVLRGHHGQEGNDRVDQQRHAALKTTRKTNGDAHKSNFGSSSDSEGNTLHHNDVAPSNKKPNRKRGKQKMHTSAKSARPHDVTTVSTKQKKERKKNKQEKHVNSEDVHPQGTTSEDEEVCIIASHVCCMPSQPSLHSSTRNSVPFGVYL